MSVKPDISVVVPLYNEVDSLEELHGRLRRQLEALGRSFEILFVDDGSTDDSAAMIERIRSDDAHVGCIRFRANFGKAAALDAGFKQARGDIVITMDADLQDDPVEISRFVDALAAGYDVVSGWKKVRHDPLSKTLPSKLFNATVRRVSGLPLHDFNCGFKAYRAEALRGIELYGELHRYLPVLIAWRGFRVTEIAVQHHPRKHSRSKYGIERFAKGLFDLLTVLLHTRYSARPLHLFGLFGLLMGTIGFAVLAYLAVLWFLGRGPIGDRPLLFLGMLLVMVGVQMVSTGLLGELVTRGQLTGRSYYVIRSFTAPGVDERQLRLK